MVGSIRLIRVTLTSLALVAGSGLSLPKQAAALEPARQADARSQAGTDAPAAKPDAKTAHDMPPASSRSDTSGLLAQPGDDPARPFVPLRASTVDDRQRIEVVRLYSAARALEDRHEWKDAVSLLQQAIKLDPSSIAVARRLSRIYIGALGRPDLALEYGKRVLAVEPGDSETLTHLVEFYKKNDPAAALVLLNEVLANPKLEAHAFGRLLAQSELGKLYSGRLHQTDKAADAYAKVLDALDDKSANGLSPSDQARILGDVPAMAYLDFATVFLAADRLDLAVKALERGLVYDEDNAQISLVLADTLLKMKRGEQALALVDRNIERQTSFMEAYELLTKVLKGLNREKEITPRLEAAARRDSKNVPLQYILADRYRETGELDKAEALYKELLSSQPTPQTYRALAASLLKRKKAADLLKVMSEAWMRGAESQEAIKQPIIAVALDDAMAEAVLDAGLQQSAANPAALSKSTYEILLFIASKPGRATTNKVRRLEKLLRLQRLRAGQNPSEMSYKEIADTLSRMGNYAEAADALELVLAKYPNAKTVPLLVSLADLHHRAKHNEAVKATVNEAMKLNPGDPESQRALISLMIEIGQVDDAVRILRDLIKKEANNVEYELDLGRILTQYGRNDEAIKLYESLLKRYSNNEEVVKLARQTLSVVYVNQGDYAKAEAELELLLQQDPDEAGTNNDLGYLYAEQGKNLEKAEAMIRKALASPEEHATNNRAYLDSLGWVLFKRGKAKEALKELTKAVEIMTAETERDGTNPDATILEHLGDVHFHLHELEKAGDAWRQAAKCAEQTTPPDRRLVEIRKKLDSLEQLGPIKKASSNRAP